MNTVCMSEDEFKKGSIAQYSASELSQSEFISEFFLKNRPVIIKDAISNSRASAWTVQSIKKDIPNQKVQIRNHASGKLFNAKDMSQEKTEMDLYEFLDVIESGNYSVPLYLAQTELKNLLPNFSDYIGRFPYLRKWDYLLQTNIWIGTPGLATPAHYDLSHNFYQQIRGHKRVTLFSPEDSPYLYINPKVPLVSSVDVGNPDLNKFPNFAKATPIQFILGPGDSVFIPARWWHFIESTDDNAISINQWFLRVWSRNTNQIKLISFLLGFIVKQILGIKSKQY